MNAFRYRSLLESSSLEDASRDIIRPTRKRAFRARRRDGQIWATRDRNRQQPTDTLIAVVAITDNRARLVARVN